MRMVAIGTSADQGGRSSSRHRCLVNTRSRSPCVPQEPKNLTLVHQVQVGSHAPGGFGGGPTGSAPLSLMLPCCWRTQPLPHSVASRASCPSAAAVVTEAQFKEI